MALLYILLIALLFGWPLTTSELARSLGTLMVTRLLRGYLLLLCFIGCIMAGSLFIEPFSLIPEHFLQLTSPVASLIIITGAALSAFLVSRISAFSSVVYSASAALMAWMAFTANTGILDVVIRNSTAWVFAPLLAGILAYGITVLYRKIQIGRSTHFFRLSYYLRIGILANTLLFALLLGANNGLLLLILNSTIRTDFRLFMAHINLNTDSFLLLISIAVICIATYSVTLRKASLHAQEIAHSGTETVLFSFVSVNIILVLFTIFLIPISVSHLVFAALTGSTLTRKNMQMDFRPAKELFWALVLNPLIAFVSTYLLLNVIGYSVLTHQTAVEVPNRINITVPVILSVIIVILILMLFYILRENKLKLKAQKEALRHQEVLFENQKSLSAMEVKTILLENENLNTTLELKRQELTNIALNISEQKSFLENIHTVLKEIRETANDSRKNKRLEELERTVLQKMKFGHEIETFYSEVENLHKDFNIRLSEQHPHLTENDKRLVILLRLGFSTKHISTLNTISPKSVEIARYRLRNKLGLSHDQRLTAYLKSI